MKKCGHSLCNQLKKNLLPEESYKLILKENKLAVTKPRISILKVLMAANLPLTVEEIKSKIGKEACDTATIYRILGQFTEIQLVNLLHLTKDTAHYEYNNPFHHHHHIVCNKCKKIELIEKCLFGEIEVILSRKGYKNIEHKLEFFGTCKRCHVA